MMACLYLWDADDVHSWICGDVLEAWKNPNVVLRYEKGKKDKPC